MAGGSNETVVYGGVQNNRGKKSLPNFHYFTPKLPKKSSSSPASPPADASDRPFLYETGAPTEDGACYKETIKVGQQQYFQHAFNKKLAKILVNGDCSKRRFNNIHSKGQPQG